MPTRKRSSKKKTLRALSLLLVGPLLIARSPLPSHQGPPGPTQGAPRASAAAALSDGYGIAHISYGNGSFSPNRYKLALQAGVRWNRRVFYANDIEASPGVLNYAKQDATVAADRAQGCKSWGCSWGLRIGPQGSAPGRQA